MLSFRICIVRAHERTFNSCVQCVCVRGVSRFLGRVDRVTNRAAVGLFGWEMQICRAVERLCEFVLMC